ncbi:sugar ABC transporter substrate-binding protein [Treponema phagedenis]|uniref:ABC transporter, solute-binding protein n=1 Tax=Treponema phagedenis TaxID=162 RepID=A0A0B7GVX3_TREPH|nr:sugar ABC transporter substrate-binding protein [Treponema phagedenis]EFW38766.1 ABC transporter, solute-binding protein [Treponema phagedenis F0421]NVP25254.1 sugar ABC transporter substrate-binding protein [Treponema phagedenis]QEJ93917.1 sugar ABC transporter substrate-binding protein [Treponema phagedenis]QEJ97071.1 sugar ABC transporter substrate-binding protein [Treponema phagedenis]QEK02074.1 sugar ABC transporter substrate-binding protein [Treponema phagedenis]
MKQKKNYSLISFIVMMIIFSVSAVCSCSKKETASNPAEAVIHVVAWNDAADALTAIAKEYNESGKLGKVIVDYVDSNYTKLTPALVSGMNVPDIFQAQNRDFPAFMNKYGSVFADLSDLIAPEKTNFEKAALAQVIGKDGKYYAVPWDIGPCAWMYRKDIFDKAGIDVSKVETWDDFIQAGKILKEKTGTYIWGFCYNGSTSIDELMLLTYQQKVSYYDADGKVNFDTPEMLRGISVLKELQKNGSAFDIPDAWNDRIKAINEGKITSLPYAVWYTGTMKNSMKDLKGKWAIAPLPSFKGFGRTANIGGSILAVSVKTKHLELCKDFLRFALMSDRGNAINFDYGLFTSYMPSFKDPAYHIDDPYFGFSLGQAFIPEANAPVINFGPYYTALQAELQTAFGQIFTQSADPSSALQKAAERAQKEIDSLQ